MRATKPTESQLRSVQEVAKVNGATLEYVRIITSLLKSGPATSLLESLHRSGEHVAEVAKIHILQQELRAKGSVNLADAIKGVADMISGRHSIIESMTKYRAEHGYSGDRAEIVTFVKTQLLSSLRTSIEVSRRSEHQPLPETSRASGGERTPGNSSAGTPREGLSPDELRRFDPRGKDPKEIEAVRDRAADALEQERRESALKSEQIALLQRELAELRAQRSQPAPRSPSGSQLQSRDDQKVL